MPETTTQPCSGSLTLVVPPFAPETTFSSPPSRGRGVLRGNARRAHIALLFLVFSAARVPAQSPETPERPPHETIRSFLATYCSDCHGEKQQKGDRRFDRLSLPATDDDALFDLQDIVDQLNLGEMPPRKSKQPTAAESKKAIALMTNAIAAYRTERTSTGGKTVLRRLNRREYLNTIRDLFGLNMTMFDPTTKFPRDQTYAHLDNIGDTLVTSGYLLAQYFEAADLIVEKALSAPAERPKVEAWNFNNSFRQQPELDHPHREAYQFRYLCLYEPTSSIRHEGAYGAIRAFSRGVPADGVYEIKVKAEAKNRRHPYDPKIFGMDPEEAFRLGIVPGNETFGPLHHPQPIEPSLGEVVIRDEEPEWYTFRVWLDAGFTPRFTFPNGMIDGRRAFSQIVNRYRQLLPENERRVTGIFNIRPVVLKHGKMPHIRIHEVEIRGPVHEEWPPAPQRAVLGSQPFSQERTRDLLTRFARRAYRRPARNDEIDRLMAVVTARQNSGRAPFDAFKDGLKAILCSPAFLYLEEPEPGAAASTPGGDRLPAHALAARLSYFLWSSMPDTKLSGLADSGELSQPDVLVAQARRMLRDRKSNQFIEAFADSWLNLRSLGDMPPDRDAFDRYYAEDLENAMQRETHLFMRHLIDQDESILRFLDADYTFVNRPLARLYGMADAVPADEAHLFRRVTLPDRNRGGLLGQASILTVSANGVETSPVTRGIWLLENILGTPPAPPPDNVPAIDPDVRGAKSIREVLTKHRDTPACFECHQKIDPLGFALENFDPIGAWRTRYDNGAPIDASGELPGGKSFSDLAGLKQILVARQPQFARMLTERLLSYSCGRRIEPRDRAGIDRIVSELSPGKDGFRRLLELVVASDTFRSK